MTWEEALERFQEYMIAKGFRERTQESYLQNVQSLVAFLQKFGVDLCSVNRSHLVGYQNHLCTRKPPLCSKTISVKLQAIRTFFRFLTQDGFLLLDPSSALLLPKEVRGLPRGVLSFREINSLLSAPDVSTPLGIRDRALLECFYGSGLRNTELRSLTLSDVDLERLEVRLSGKGGKVRVVPITEEAAYWLDCYLRVVRPTWNPGTSVIFLTKNGKPFGRTHLSFLVKTLAKRASLKKPISCHALRHTCATHLLRGKADLRSIQELLGHAKLSTTQLYTKVEISDLKRVHARCHPRAKRHS